MFDLRKKTTAAVGTVGAMVFSSVASAQTDGTGGLDVSSAVTAIEGASGTVATVGVAILGVAAAIFGIRAVRGLIKA